jgi:hypothetical protein
MILGLNQTSPSLAAIMSHKDFQLQSAFPEFQNDWVSHYISLVKAGVLPSDQAEARILPFSGAMLALVKSAFQGLDTQQANEGFKVALSMLNLSNAQIKKVMQVPLPPA